jgi:hypothetical protein
MTSAMEGGGAEPATVIGVSRGLLSRMETVLYSCIIDPTAALRLEAADALAEFPILRHRVLEELHVAPQTGLGSVDLPGHGGD